MTREDIFEMLKKAGVGKKFFDPYFNVTWGDIEKICNIAADYERERCARVCFDLHSAEDSGFHFIPDGRRALYCAESMIRAKGEK